MRHLSWLDFVRKSEMLTDLAKFVEKHESELFAVSSRAIAAAYSMACCRLCYPSGTSSFLDAIEGIAGKASDVYRLLLQLTSNGTLVVSAW